MEQTELAALTSNSLGTPKPMLWERRAPARQKTRIMCKSGVHTPMQLQHTQSSTLLFIIFITLLVQRHKVS